ncbi:MAG: heparan-alpha-glucosaminide N-acetyltransferase domain-containing protein [Acidobacteriaceae bacterium]|nr:heparan-alpha-glucosaminide N-acetyltransferase domain-containing protein [Acidobacteriaceae bacterium]
MGIAGHVHDQNETKTIERHIAGPRRVLSVDMLRGVAIALMILVNNPGDWGHVFPWLEHSAWDGCTLADLVFPCFLFLAGVSTVFSLASRAHRGNCRGTMAGHLFARCGRLLLLAFVLAFLPAGHWGTLRFFGVLPRIAFCSLATGLILLLTRRLRWLGLLVLGVLLSYGAVLRFVPVPPLDGGTPRVQFLDPVNNPVAYVDRALVSWSQRWLHTGILFEKTSDPEGALSSLGALATTLLGAMCGLWIRGVGRGSRSLTQMRTGLLLGGVLSAVSGAFWALWLPINKSLWTPSYALLAAGVSLLALAACSLLVDGRVARWPLWLRISTWPWFVFGSNAIVAYVFSEGMVKIFLYARVADGRGELHTVWTRFYQVLFSRGHSTEWTSLAFAVAYVCICFLPNWTLWHKRVFLKI